MSYTSSNLYASRIYAEHPVALWAMDEPNYFVSLISEEEKEITETYWEFDNVIRNSSAVFTLSGYPFDDLDVNKLYLSTASAATKQFEVSLSSPISYIDLDVTKGSICVSNYIYIPEKTFLQYVEIGFVVDGQESFTRYISGASESLKTNNWEKISHTESIGGENFSPFIRVVYDPDVDADEEESSVYFNGVSVGQWSEPYSSISTGINSESLATLPSDISSLVGFPGELKGSIIDPYGFNNTSDNGYIVSINNSLFGKLSGVPMVYGSSGNMKLNKNLIVFGESLSGGLFSTTVFEDEIDANPTSYEEEVDGGSSVSEYEEVVEGGSSTSSELMTIDGGSSSLFFLDDVDGGIPYSPFLTEEEYDRVPNLIFPGKGFLNKNGSNKTLTTEFWIRISPEEEERKRIFGPLASKDGIYVDRDFITLNVGKYTKSYFIGQWYRPMLVHFSQSQNEIFLMINGEKVISIPIDSLEIETFPDKEKDYLGFYTTSNTYLYEIDSFSIFPYVVAEQIAKKRYVFGQGVQEQDNIISAKNGNLSYVDFPFSGYSSTIKYPDRSKWNDGFYNNIVASDKGISLPEYQLPEILFNNTATLTDYEKTLITSSFYEENYLIQDEPYPYISMDPNNTYLTRESYGTIYFSKLNKTNYQTRSVHSLLKSSSDVSSRQSLIYISSNFNSNVFEVVINSGSIQYMFNDVPIQGTTTSISPNSYFAVGIDFDKIEQSYYSSVGSFFSRTESLSLNFAGNQQNVFLGKIFSLTMNNDFFTDKDGSQIFNSSGIAIKNFNSNLYDYIGSYTLLPKETNTSMALDVGVSGYWENSIPLSYFGKYITQSDGELKYDLDLIQFNIDTPNSIFSKFNQKSSSYENSLSTKVYITLQSIVELGQVVYTQFTNIENIGMGKILDLGEVTSSENTKYRINNGTVIYPPKDLSGFTNYYITVHIEISSKGVNTQNVQIKDMGLASLSFDEGQFYSINTPAAGKFYPIVKNEDQYVYKRKVPVVIDTYSSPYLYLAGDSGIEVLPDIDENLVKGISIPINETLKVAQEVVGLQMFLMYNESNTFTETKKIGKIFSSNNSYDIVLEPEDDGKRAFFYIFDSTTGRQFTAAKFFLNGKLVNDIVIEPLSWNYIAISLQANSISLDGIIGEIEIYSGVKVDNVASFMELNPVKQELITYDEWDKLDDPIPPSASATVWDYWSASSTWTEILDEQSLEVTILSLDGKDIFNTYAGLSSGIVVDESIINVSQDSVVIINDISWDEFLI
jgi:hypothetical protein